MSKRKTIFPLEGRVAFSIFIVVMLLLLAVSIFIAISWGSVSIDPSTIRGVVINQLTGHAVVPVTWEESTRSIIWNIRLPRIFTAWIVGAGLTLCGIVMQALTKNPLADPFVLGISHGASAGAVSVIMYGYLSFLGYYATMCGAFIGALVAMLLALGIARMKNVLTATNLILAGIAVSALFGALTNLMIYTHQSGSDKVKTAQYWLMGSLSGANWIRLAYAMCAFVICCLLILMMHRSLDTLMLGDETATTLGVNTARIKRVIIIVATALTGVIVSISGVIGFVGLTVPHMTRSVVGSKHSRLIPASILLGGSFMVLADLLSRTLIRPEELPIGVVSAFFGAPFFLYLIKRSQS